MTDDNLLTDREGESLLKIARHTLAASQGKLQFFPTIDRTDALKENRGLFVALRKGELLRGCIGSVNPGKPLEEAIAELAMKSALKDPRFEPISEAEIPLLTIQISILSTPAPIDPNDIELGVHGLILMKQGICGLLLPSVAIENQWSVQELIEQTCLKAGLLRHDWKENAHLLGFTVQIFQGNAQ